MERVRETIQADGFIKRFLDKWHGVDEKQVKALDNEIRTALIQGSEDEVRVAYETIQIRQEFYGKTLLGTAAWDLIWDMRATLELYQE